MLPPFSFPPPWSIDLALKFHGKMNTLAIVYGCRIEASGSKCKYLYVKLRKCSIECQTIPRNILQNDEWEKRTSISIRVIHIYILSFGMTHSCQFVRIVLFFSMFWCETNLHMLIKINKLKIYSIWIWNFSDFLLYFVIINSPIVFSSANRK